MIADCFHKHGPCIESHLYPQPVLIPAEVEDDVFALNDAGSRVSFLEVVRRFPCGTLDLFFPCFQLRSRVRMLAFEGMQQVFSDQFHR